MRPFEPRGTDVVTTIEQIEAVLLTQLVGQIGTLLDSIGDSTPDAPRDAALLRLLPDAYPGDREASAEFRRFTAAGLAEKKARNADVVVRDLAAAVTSVDPSEVCLDAESVQAWLRSLTDVRLVLATRLGIVNDDPDGGDGAETSRGGDDADDHDAERMLGDIYDWLGWVQGSLVHCLDTVADGDLGLVG